VRVLVSGSTVNGVSGDASVGRAIAQESLGESASASGGVKGTGPAATRCVVAFVVPLFLLRRRVGAFDLARRCGGRHPGHSHPGVLRPRLLGLGQRNLGTVGAVVTGPMRSSRITTVPPGNRPAI